MQTRTGQYEKDHNQRDDIDVYIKISLKVWKILRRIIQLMFPTERHGSVKCDRHFHLAFSNISQI